MEVLYLHGFASSPNSTKAAYVRELLNQDGHQVVIPDLNVPSFEGLHIEAIISKAGDTLRCFKGASAIIGSSLGGYVALQLLARRLPGSAGVAKLVLVAPALSFLHSKALTPELLAQWKERGNLSVYHSGTKTNRLIGAQFLHSLEALEQVHPPHVESLIIHGTNDEIIDIQRSRDFAACLPHGHLVELETDHQLIDQLPRLGKEIRDFLHT